MTSYWWIDRALPGVVGALIVAAVMAVSHILLRRHITRVTDRQTAMLAGSGPKASGGADDAA